MVKAVSAIRSIPLGHSTPQKVASSIKTASEVLVEGEAKDSMIKRSGLNLPTNCVLLRFMGEGIPYYEGFAAFNSETNQVIGVWVREMW